MNFLYKPNFTTEDALDAISHAVEYAEHRFPRWPTSTSQHYAVCILTEEVGKLAQATNKMTLAMTQDEYNIHLRDMQEYAASIGAMAVRVLKGLPTY